MSEKTKPSSHASPDLFQSSREFFTQMIQDAFDRRQIKTLPLATSYLVDLLEHYLITEHLFDEEDQSGRKTRESLAMLFLKAGQSEPRVRRELLKKLGDTSLYISGFFADSLQRKTIDVDYYVEMGGAAYSSLASSVTEESYSELYREFSRRFLDFVEALTYISTQSQIQANNNLLRMYDIYAQTGSAIAREQLLEKGIIALPQELIKRSKASGN